MNSYDYTAQSRPRKMAEVDIASLQLHSPANTTHRATENASSNPRHRRPSDPKYESFFLARPPGTNTTTLALQLQRITQRGNSILPLFDIKQNLAPTKRLMKKVRSFNEVVGVIIPPTPLHHHNHSEERSRSPSSLSSSSVDDSSPAPTYSVYDRDTPREPVAQFSKHGISFSQHTTPLLSRHSRLGRHINSHIPPLLDEMSPIFGPVSWMLVEDRNSAFKIVDSSTNAIIGRWKPQSALSGQSNGTSRRRRVSLDTATPVGSPPGTGSPLGCEATSNYIASSRNSTPFFSGELASACADNVDLTWCLIIKGTVVATLKGYELNVVQPLCSDNNQSIDSLMACMFLDEFTKTLRQKHRAKIFVDGSSTSLPSVQEEQMSAETKNSGRASNIFRRSSKSKRRHSLPGMSAPGTNAQPSPPRSSFSESTTPPLVTNFFRLKFSDAVIMSAMSLMLNMDDRLRRASALAAVGASVDATSGVRRTKRGSNSSASSSGSTSSSNSMPHRNKRGVPSDIPEHGFEKDHQEKKDRRHSSIFKVPSFFKIKALHA